MQRLKESALPTRGENLTAPDDVTRRDVLKLMMGASTALALGGAGCARKPRREIISRVQGPEYQKPGRPLFYSSTWTQGQFPYGLMVKTVDGRPIKVEGNPDHPIGGGTSTAAMQASILSLYDPDRLRGPSLGDTAVSWEAMDKRILEALSNASSVVLITRATLGPSERALIGEFTKIVPGARHFVHEALHDRPRRTAHGKVYGVDGEMLPRFDRARVVLSLESDFMGTDGPVLENIRAFAKSRSLDDQRHADARITRLYVVESAMTLTGSNADHRIRLRPSAMSSFAAALRLAVDGESTALEALATEHKAQPQAWKALARDLRENRGASIVLAGPHLPESVHAAVALLNDTLQAPGKTLEFNPSPATMPTTDPAEVEAALADGVDVLVCLGVNPVYDWPGGGFEKLIAKAAFSIGHGLYGDETILACDALLPSNHNFESWGDAEPRSGVRSVCQPVIAPLFDTRQEAESLLIWLQGLSAESSAIRSMKDWHDYVRLRWEASAAINGAGDGDASARRRSWEDALRLGGRFQPASPSFPALKHDVAEQLAQGSSPGTGFEFVIHPHHAVHDGRFANSGWLQELPCPISKLVWDNVAAISPETAKALSVSDGDLIRVAVGEKSVALPAAIQRGMADQVVALTLGHGRTQGGVIALEAGGANVARLIGQGDASTPHLAVAAGVSKTDGFRKLVRTQKQFSMHDRPIVLDGDLDEYRQHADFVKHKRHLPEAADLYEPVDYSNGHKWEMAIDLGSCVGCGACVTACQAENNIPIVGRDQCDKGREMHWMRIDRYEEGDANNPTVHHQPMMCQHCDDAPCESVCPVNATTHSPEGLNEMTYNRCVGTRYCANNCPYKVRRFNFLRFQDAQLRDPVQELVFNPQVTVRGIGVMEKCTFCVQRINEEKFKASNRGVDLADGAIQTACQQACPAQAIVFGDANLKNGRLAAAKSSQRGFRVLEELNIQPSVTYLAKVRNPNPSTPQTHDGSTGSHHG